MHHEDFVPGEGSPRAANDGPKKHVGVQTTVFSRSTVGFEVATAGVPKRKKVFPGVTKEWVFSP